MRSVEREYRRVNESVMPDAALIARTRAAMAEEMTAEKLAARREKRLLRVAASYAAVAAASVLICVGVMRTLPGGKTESAAEPMESIVEMEMYNEATAEESAASNTMADSAMAEESRGEFADITIYYLKNGNIKSDVAKNTECSVDNIFALWAEKNDVEGVQLLVVDIYSNESSVGVQLDFSPSFREYLDEEGLLAASLSMTIGEYLNADGVILTVDGQPI